MINNLKLEAGLNQLENSQEQDFFKTAFQWHGSVTPKVAPRVVLAGLYALFISFITKKVIELDTSIRLFEYFGAILGLLLVLRVNSGLDRWNEARRIWGNIVNQSRNLANIGFVYSPNKNRVQYDFLRFVAVFPYIILYSLRQQIAGPELERLVGNREAEKIRAAHHMPIYVSAVISEYLYKMRTAGLDEFSFSAAERERAALVDALGACERIRSTPMPLVLAIKIRRFILLFTILLPFTLVHSLHWYTPLVVMLITYPLLALDEIGSQLQNPFLKTSLSHLPLDKVCATIEKNVLNIGEFYSYQTGNMYEKPLDQLPSPTVLQNDSRRGRGFPRSVEIEIGPTNAQRPAAAVGRSLGNEIV